MMRTSHSLLGKRVVTLFSLAAICIFTGCVARDVPLVKRANAWKTGEQIPAELLVFREAVGCFGLSTDTAPVFGRITNYDLLRTIIFTPNDERIFACAVAQALSLVGPNRFFGDAEKQYASHPELLSQQRHRSIHVRAKLPHVVVDGLFIDDSDISRKDADGIFAQVTADLKAGAPFDTVQKKVYKAHEYSYIETLSDGTQLTLHRTRVGNYGEFVVSKSNRDALPFRIAEVPASHVQPLLKQRVGETIVIRDEARKRSIFYRVREYYTPPR